MNKGKIKTFLGIGILIMVFIISGCSLLEAESYATTDINEYRNFKGHIAMEEEDIFSGLEIFPLEITDEMKDVSYIYECGSFALDNDYLIYLECDWIEGSFEKEIQRLKNITVSNEFQTKNIIYDSTAFAYPAYVAVCNGYDYSMEYALIDEENKKIIYLYSQFKSDIESKINNEYLLVESKDIENELLKNGYNIYLFKVNENESEYIK